MAATPPGEAPPSLPSFLLCRCPCCEREVLTARRLGADDALQVVCLHCEQQLDAEAPDARWVGPEGLAEAGYELDADFPGVEAEEPDGERGCRGGACGVRQPGDSFDNEPHPQ